MVNWHQLPHTGIQHLTPYQPGKSEDDLFRERGIKEALKLASNENPLGCSDAVMATLSDLTAKQIAAYPGPFHHPLKTKIAQSVGVAPTQVVLTNGSDALFSHIFTLFCLHQQKSVLTHRHCFPSYPIQAQTLGIPIHLIPLDDQWGWDYTQFSEACDAHTGVIIFANPNNPTGVKVPLEAINALLEHIPSEVIVVIDEAYYEYAFADASQSSSGLLASYPNVVITRSFSKAYGLANCRLGYAIGHPDVIELIWRIQQPFAVNGIALACAEAAWQDQAFVQRSIALNAHGQRQMAEGLDRLAYRYIPSATNFMTIEVPGQAAALNDYLLNQGIIVRPLSASGMADHLRITIGTQQQNDQVLAALAQFSAQH